MRLQPNTMCKKHIPKALAAALLSIISTQGAQVNAEETSALTLEEIVVTAQRRTQSLQDVPIAVNAISADQLEQSGVASLEDVSKIAPGLSIGDNGGAPDKVIGLRGLATATLGVGVEASTATYIDGVYQRGGMLTSMLNDIAQVEVLKGPQGTLFGRNAAAGAINIRTNAPEDGFGGKVNASIGNEGMYKLSGVVNQPLSKDVLSRTSFVVKKRDGWQEDVDSAGADDLNEVDSYLVRSRISWDINDSLAADFTVDYQESAGTRGGLVTEEAVAAFPSGFTAPQNLDKNKASMSGLIRDKDGNLVPFTSERETESLGVSVSLDWDINDDLSLISVTAYRDSEANIPMNSGGLYSPVSVDLGPGTPLPYSAGYVGVETFEFETFSQEFRLSGMTDSVDWFVGFNYFKDESNKHTRMALPAFYYAAVADPDTDADNDPGIPQGRLDDGENNTTVEIESYALFGDVIFQLNDKWRLTTGLRYSYDEKKVSWADNNQTAFGFFADVENGVLVTAGVPAKADDDWSNISGRLVLDYALSDDTMLYASAAQGYKSGGFNTDITPGANPSNTFDLEESVSYEFGMKSSLLDDRLMLNAAVFFNDYSDYQFQVSVPGQLTPVSLGGDAEIFGTELELTYLASENLTLTAKISTLEAEYVSDVTANGPLGQFTAVKKGQEMMRAPEYAGVVGADYLWMHNSGSSVRFNLLYSFTDDYRLSNTNLDNLQGNGLTFTEDDVRTDAHGLLTARITFTDQTEEWGVSLWGTNLTDESYREEGHVSIGNAVYSQLGAATKTYARNQPRMYGVDFTYNF